jgi:hypothetical protein
LRKFPSWSHAKPKKHAYKTLKRKSWHLIVPIIFNHIWTIITQKMELWNSWGIALNTKNKKTKKKTKTMVKLNQLVTRINLMEFVIMLEILANISNVTFTSWPFSYFTWHFQQVIASFLCQKHENSPQSKELPMCITTNKLKHNSNHNQSINMFSFKEKLFKE